MTKVVKQVLLISPRKTSIYFPFIRTHPGNSPLQPSLFLRWLKFSLPSPYSIQKQGDKTSPCLMHDFLLLSKTQHIQSYPELLTLRRSLKATFQQDQISVSKWNPQTIHWESHFLHLITTLLYGSSVILEKHKTWWEVERHRLLRFPWSGLRMLVKSLKMWGCTLLYEIPWIHQILKSCIWYPPPPKKRLRIKVLWEKIFAKNIPW